MATLSICATGARVEASSWSIIGCGIGSHNKEIGSKGVRFGSCIAFIRRSAVAMPEACAAGKSALLVSASGSLLSTADCVITKEGLAVDRGVESNRDISAKTELPVDIRKNELEAFPVSFPPSSEIPENRAAMDNLGENGSESSDENDSKAVGASECNQKTEESSGRKEHKMRWSMLLSREALEDAHLSRASSVADAHVLRRKGRLKEQDGLIEFVISMHSTHSPVQVMEKMQTWVREHCEDPMRSTLSRLVPSVGRFYTPLPLVRAFFEYDEFASLSRRRYVPPNFAEIRHVLNIAQVHAIAEKLALVTFDADGTIYSDGHHIARDNKMVAHIVKLMQYDIHVAILTAAGYPGDPARFEDRFAGLLSAFEELELPPRITQFFHVMGDDLWKPKDMLEWSEEDVRILLDEAEGALQSASARLKVPVQFVRKPRAVGVIPKQPTIYEVLEEMALTVQVQLIDATLPFCAFNGGNDVFVDIGNKSIGLGALMNYLGKKPHETLHVGDRFTVSGNDSAARSKCPILWVANPEETGFFARLLHSDIRLAQLTPYIE